MREYSDSTFSCSLQLYFALPVSQEEILLKDSGNHRKYILADGQSQAVDGHISFGDEYWSVTFFILDENGNPLGGSAEGGRYELENENLTFFHHYNLSDIDKGVTRPLQKSVFNESEEPEYCYIELEDDILVIYFPSGNAMIFSKLENI